MKNLKDINGVTVDLEKIAIVDCFYDKNDIIVVQTESGELYKFPAQKEYKEILKPRMGGNYPKAMRGNG